MIVVSYVDTPYLNCYAVDLYVIEICLVRKSMCFCFPYFIAIGICIVLNIMHSWYVYMCIIEMIYVFKDITL